MEGVVNAVEDAVLVVAVELEGVDDVMAIRESTQLDFRSDRTV